MSCVPIIKLSRHYLYSRLSGRIYCELLRMTKWHSACMGRSETARISVTPTPTLSFQLHSQHGHRKLWRILTEDCKLHPSQLMSKLCPFLHSHHTRTYVAGIGPNNLREGFENTFSTKILHYKTLCCFTGSWLFNAHLLIFMSNQDKESTISFDFFKHSFSSC